MAKGKGKAKARNSKARKSTRKNNKKAKFSKLKFGIKLVVAGTLLVCLFVVLKYGILMVKYKEYAAEIVSNRNSFKSSLTTLVYDKDGENIINLSAEKDSYYLEADEIPYIVKRTFVTSEDRSFYEHKGVDLKAIVRAFVALVNNSGEVTQGGSTITQQLARNIFLSHEVSLERKVKEMFIATELEKAYTKDEILEFYINNIYFGNGFYGIEAASMGYFNKTVTDLNNSEMIFLCAIPNNPTKYDPLENMEHTINRRNLLAKQLYEQQVIDKSLYEEIVGTEIVIYLTKDTKYDYVETFVRYCATRELMRARGFVFAYEFDSKEAKRDYDEAYAEEYSYCNSLLFTGGYRIYTTIDMDKQEMLQATVNEVLERYSDTNEEGIYKLQGSSTCIDNLTGFVVAIVGGREQEQKGYSLNRAFQSFRQPGSSIKPLLVYTPAFERGYSPETIILDEKFEGGPVNADKTYAGAMDIRTAVEKSKNTVAWKIFDKIGPFTAMPYILKMDFKKIVDTDYVKAASLGGLTYGVSTHEMAGAYATLQNSGVYRSATCILKITDDSGNIIIDNTGDKHISKRIYEENAADTMTNVLLGVLTKGTGRKYPVDGVTCAAKTGTTNNNYDSWFVGYSYYYTTAVWCGYDMPEALDEDYGTTCPGRIWQSYMKYLHKDLPNIEIGTYVPTAGIPGEAVTEDETTLEAETDESGNIIELETDEYGNVIEPVIDIQSLPSEEMESEFLENDFSEETTESPTDEYGNVIEPITDVQQPLEEETEKAVLDDDSPEETMELSTESSTDENGNNIEPDTGIYIPDDLLEDTEEYIEENEGALE